MSNHRELYPFNPAELTFGLEFEFEIMFYLVSINDSKTSVEDTLDYIIKLLGNRVPNATFLTQQQYSAVQSLVVEGEEASPDTEWILLMNNSFPFGQGEPIRNGCVHISLELKSPVIRCNETHSFRVHVGRGLAGFNIVPLRHLMATLWTFEEQILPAVDPYYRPDNNRSKSIRKHSQFAKKVADYKLSDENILRRLLGFSTNNELVDAYSGDPVNGPMMSYEVRNLREPFSSETSKRTIEFRQHAGTTDFYTVLRWVTFIQDVTVWAHRRPSDYVTYFLRKYIARKLHQYDIDGLCTEIGMVVPSRK
ncbi:hypothetical protein ACMFMG_005162 [Clarireedia jacksonii]